MTDDGPNKERIKLLVDALRSDEFEQCHGLLKKVLLSGSTQHCCLGVACDVAIANGLDLTQGVASRGGLFGSVGFGEYREPAKLPKEVRRWYGFDDNDPILRLTGHPDKWWKFWQLFQLRNARATVANDDLKLNFKQIARAFKRTYL